MNGESKQGRGCQGRGFDLDMVMPFPRPLTVPPVTMMNFIALAVVSADAEADVDVDATGSVMPSSGPSLLGGASVLNLECCGLRSQQQSRAALDEEAGEASGGKTGPL